MANLKYQSDNVKNDVYRIVTDKILELLDKGTVHWHQPWHGGSAGWPKSLLTKKQYQKLSWNFSRRLITWEKQRSWTMLSNDCSKKEKLDEHGDGSKRVGWSRIGRG